MHDLYRNRTTDRSLAGCSALAGALLLAFCCRSAAALESAEVKSPRATVTLASDTDAVSPGRPFHLGLHFKLSPGWQVYWSNPGDAGQAPTLTLHLPAGARSSGILWPAPVLRKEGTVATYAYTGELVLPVSVTLPSGSAAQPLSAEATWLVCADVCVPEKGRFTLSLPSGTARPSALAPLFAAAAARWPQRSPYVAHIAPDGVLSLTGAGLSAQSVQRAWFFPAAWGSIDQGAAQRLKVSPGQVQLALAPGQTFDPHATLGGVLTIADARDHERYLQIAATPTAAPTGIAAPPTVSNASALARTMLFALIAGLILNLMPCVFPVLAIKALSLMELAKAGRGAARTQALAYCAGVLLAFSLLGLLLLALRAAGTAAGWGFQFQSPLFVTAMACLLFALGLNLSGVFVAGSALMGIGDTLASRGRWFGSFFAGLLAVVIATPCTAPFMGAAIAVALTASWPLALSIFVALGAGFAGPVLLLALVPAWGRWLPRPGPWMVVFKEALAFPMYGATVWLLWVVSQQRGSNGMLAAAISLVLVGFAAWALGWGQRTRGHSRLVARLAVLAAVLALAAPLLSLHGAPSPAGGIALGASPASSAQSYSAAHLAALRAQDRPVFVDMTAAWCVTCLLNERVALSSARVRAAFAQHHVVYMKGDWTSQDPAISQFLHQYDRNGVPLYVFYPSGAASPRVLPQILTENLVLQLLKPQGG